MLKVREMDIEFYRHHFHALEAAREPPWRYEEHKPRGCNFDSFFLARVYDTYHQMFRDYRREAEEIVTALGLSRSAIVLDMGCGTGAFALHGAPHYRKVYAVDVAKAMLSRARRKARKAGLTNIEFHRGGFLSYEHAGDALDAIVSVLALHHLPDFWKFVGLHRLASLLRPGGRLYLRDVVFSFGIGCSAPAIERFIRQMSIDMGPDGRTAAETHVREEYSTWSWIMEGLLERAGFRIDEADSQDDCLATYLCTKKPAPVSANDGVTQDRGLDNRADPK